METNMPLDVEAGEKPHPKPGSTPKKNPTDAPVAQPCAAAKPRYLTRRQAVAYANETLGVPMKAGTYAKKAMKGRGMKPDLYYGRIELFTPETVERYVFGELTGSEPFNLETET
jgi:hypothetical protein